MLHFAIAGVGFLALVVAAFVVAAWFRRRGENRRALWSRVAGLLILVGFIGGAALADNAAGVGLLWLAVATGWIWLSTTSLRVYRTVPHPDLEVRQASDV